MDKTLPEKEVLISKSINSDINNPLPPKIKLLTIVSESKEMSASDLSKTGPHASDRPLKSKNNISLGVSID